MRFLWRFILGILIVLIVAMLHYTLPSRDVVRVVGTDVKRMDVGRVALFWANPDAGTNQNYTRDVRFINTVWPDGTPRVYRNEDTDWSWPPYLKFDSSNLTATAQSLSQQGDAWVAVTHYGWRIKLFSIFPNAVKIRSVSGPDVFLVPWFNILFIGLLLLIAFGIWRFTKRIKTQHIDPVTSQITETAESAQDSLNRQGNAISAVWRRWFGTTKPRK